MYTHTITGPQFDKQMNTTSLQAIILLIYKPIFIPQNFHGIRKFQHCCTACKTSKANYSFLF